MKSSLDAALRKQGSNGSSNNNDMGSTTKSVLTKPGSNKVSPINGKIHTSAFHHVQQWTPVPAAAAAKDKAAEAGKKNAAGGKDKAGEAESKRPCAVHVENGGSAGVPQSNVTDPSGPVEGHAANYGSNSGSNNNGSTAATAAAANVETGGINKRSGHAMCLKRERRVAAVNKFREKRKERNFGKKVHSSLSYFSLFFSVVAISI
jgi:pseudo-response regulator 7